jgi:hypothetical protein
MEIIIHHQTNTTHHMEIMTQKVTEYGAKATTTKTIKPMALNTIDTTDNTTATALIKTTTTMMPTTGTRDTP